MEKKLGDKLKWLDPFTYVDLYVMPVVNPKKNGVIETIVYVFFAFIFAYLIYNFILAGLLGTSAPLVIVYSGSMEPFLYRGDIVVLGNASQVKTAEADVDFPLQGRRLSEYAQVLPSSSGSSRQYAILIDGEEKMFDPKGDIVVYTSRLVGQDIIHRAVLKLNAPDGAYLITFGDNNSRIDEDCSANPNNPGCISLTPVPLNELKGKYLFHVPLLGYVKLILFDDLPWVVNCLALSERQGISFADCALTFDPAARSALLR